MDNCFRRRDIMGASSHQRRLIDALSCCVKRLSLGLYTVVRACSRPEHRQFQWFIDDPTLLATIARGRHPGAARADIARSGRALHRLLALHSDPPAGTVVSHQSAAVIHRLPVLDVPGREVRYLSASRSRRRGASIVVKRTLAEADISWVLDRRITTPVRTVVDLAVDDSLTAGVLAADAVLAMRATRAEGETEAMTAVWDLEPEQRRILLERTADRAPNAAARSRAHRALGIATGLSESPAESLTLVALDRLGLLDRARQQVTVPLPPPVHTARVDLLIDEDLVVEVDGWSKYEGDETALRREKRREDALRAAGFRVVRLEWRDLLDTRAVTAKLHRAGLRRTT